MLCNGVGWVVIVGMVCAIVKFWANTQLLASVSLTAYCPIARLVKLLFEFEGTLKSVRIKVIPAELGEVVFGKFPVNHSTL